MPPALYWYKPSRLIQRANRRCFWLLILATLCAVSLVRGTSFTLMLPVAVLLPVLLALVAREIHDAFIGVKKPVARIDGDGLHLARSRPFGHLGGNRLNWHLRWQELQDADFNYEPQQLILKRHDGSSEHIRTAPMLDEDGNHDLYLVLSRLHGYTKPLSAGIAAELTALAVTNPNTPPRIRPLGWLLLALNLATALALPLLAALTNGGITLISGICAALILYGLHHGIYSFSDYRQQADSGERAEPPPPEAENARYWYKHPRVVRSCNIRLYFWLLLALFLLTSTTTTAPRWYLEHPGWALFDLILMALVLRALWCNFRHGFLAPAEPFASADRHGLRLALSNPRLRNLADLPVDHLAYKRFGVERFTGGKLYSGARNGYIAWQELLGVHAVAEYNIFPEQLQFHIRDFTLAHSHRSIRTKRLCDYAAICDIAATANAACAGTPPTPGAWQPPLRVRPLAWLLLAFNLACFTGWLTGLIPLNITAYDGLHGHPYGIFLYPNPFSIGLLNLIALALPWRWQATYRTTP
jgi:membrane protein